MAKGLRVNPELMNKIREIADEVSRREGCLLYDVEFIGAGKHRTLRVYIDAEPGPVSVDQCANVSRGLSLLLDVQDVVGGGAYELEVSSPGVERALKQPWHYRHAVGQPVKITTTEPIAGLKGQAFQVVGALVAADEQEVVVEAKEAQVKVPLGVIKKANVIFEFNKKN